MEEAQIEQLRASYRGQRTAIHSLKKKLHTEHKQRALAEASLSVVTRYWDQLEQLMQDVTKEEKNLPTSKTFTETLNAIHAVLDVDVTYRRDRETRVETLLDGPFVASDDDDDEDEDEDGDDMQALTSATQSLLSNTVEPSVAARCDWAKKSVAVLLAKSSNGGSNAGALAHSQLKTKLIAVSDAALVVTKQLTNTATLLDEQTYLNESLMRRLEALRHSSAATKDNGTGNGNGSGKSSGSNSSGGSGEGGGGGSGSGGGGDGSNQKVIDDMKSKMEEFKNQLTLEQQLSKARLGEVEELLNVKKELSSTLGKYESGDIPMDILERATSYVQLKRDSDDNSRQLLAMSTNDATMRDNMENMRYVVGDVLVVVA
jgi:hypothetical protein